LDSKAVRPYIVGGFGLMHAGPASGKRGPAAWLFAPNHESELEASGKIRLGLEVRRDNASFGIQGGLISGSGDLAGVVYQNWTMGFTHHW
jgi:hypothetical protein